VKISSFFMTRQFFRFSKCSRLNLFKNIILWLHFYIKKIQNGGELKYCTSLLNFYKIYDTVVYDTTYALVFCALEEVCQKTNFSNISLLCRAHKTLSTFHKLLMTKKKWVFKDFSYFFSTKLINNSFLFLFFFWFTF
jgi:hypothetical protein